jgi:hypothetical protein
MNPARARLSDIVCPARIVAGVWLAVASLVGCGDGKPATYRVRVRVVLAGGQPLAGGRIELQSLEVQDAQGQPFSAAGLLDDDGWATALSTFDVDDGVVAGKQRAAVAPPRRHVEGGRMFDDLLDPQYLDSETSGLEILVAPTSAVQEFTLEVAGPARRVRSE